MSCGSGDSSCEKPRRRAALVLLGLMALIFIALSVFSFLPSRGQATPDTVSFGPYQANDGKRVFQAYSPAIDSIEVKRHGKVRGAKLYYLRGLEGKAARITEDLAARGKDAESRVK